MNKRTNGCDDGGSNHGFIGEGTLAVSNEILEGITEGSVAEEQEEHEKDEMMKVEGAAEDECIGGKYATSTPRPCCGHYSS